MNASSPNPALANQSSGKAFLGGADDSAKGSPIRSNTSSAIQGTVGAIRDFKINRKNWICTPIRLFMLHKHYYSGVIDIQQFEVTVSLQVSVFGAFTVLPPKPWLTSTLVAQLFLFVTTLDYSIHWRVALLHTLSSFRSLSHANSYIWWVLFHVQLNFQ